MSNMANLVVVPNPQFEFLVKLIGATVLLGVAMGDRNTVRKDSTPGFMTIRLIVAVLRRQ